MASSWPWCCSSSEWRPRMREASQPSTVRPSTIASAAAGGSERVGPPTHRDPGVASDTTSVSATEHTPAADTPQPEAEAANPPEAREPPAAEAVETPAAGQDPEAEVEPAPAVETA